MDIDEFLDTETSKIAGKAKIMPSSFSQGGDMGGQQQKDQGENLFHNLDSVRLKIKSDVSSALDEFQVIQNRYTEVTKKQFSQNKFLFNELLRTNQQIVNQIKSLRDDAYKKINYIQNLLKEAQQRLKTNDIKGTKKLNLEINDLYNAIPDVFDEEKKSIKNYISFFSATLSMQIQHLESIDFNNKKKQIIDLIKSNYDYFQQNGGKLPKDCYVQINKLYSELPDGHIYEKALLYGDILKLFRTSFLMNESDEFVNAILGQVAKNSNIENLAKIGDTAAAVDANLQAQAGQTEQMTDLGNAGNPNMDDAQMPPPPK